MPLDISSTDEEQVNVSVAPTTTSGRPARLDGALTVTVVDGDGTVLQDPASPLAFKAVSGPGPGITHYLVSGDADLGAGVVEVQDTVTYTVTGVQAANLGLVAGAIEPKP
jgi:hypothetical protein